MYLLKVTLQIPTISYLSATILFVLLAFGIVIATNIAPQPAYAAGAQVQRTTTVHRSSIQSGELPKPPTDSGTINKIMGVFFAIIGAFALLMIVASGMKYITAGGDPQRASEARKGIIYALVGLAFAISAESLVVFLVNRV